MYLRIYVAYAPFETRQGTLASLANLHHMAGRHFDANPFLSSPRTLFTMRGVAQDAFHTRAAALLDAIIDSTEFMSANSDDLTGFVFNFLYVSRLY